MKNTDVPTNTLRAIESILRKNTIYVKYSNEVSVSWKVRRGVRQGCVLSAHLFVFYIDSTNREFSELLYGINKLNKQAYAENFFVYTPTGLRNTIEALHVLLTAYSLQVNSSKTKVLFFLQNNTENSL